MKFSFTKSNLGLTQEEVIKAEENKGGGSRFMDPGVHSVKIVEADFHKNRDTQLTSCKSDPTWHNIKVVYENGAGQRHNHYVQIPTSKLTFTVNGQKGPKESAFMFVKFRQFCAGIGEVADIDATKLGALMNKYFATPNKLVGKNLEITLGYQGAYLSYMEGRGDEAAYAIMNKDGTILDPGPYTKKTAVVEAAKRQTIITELELLSITSRVVEAPVEEVAAKAEKKEEEW